MCDLSEASLHCQLLEPKDIHSLLHTPNVSSGMETGISILLAVIGLYGRSRTMYGSLKQIGRTSLSATINSRYQTDREANGKLKVKSHSCLPAQCRIG